MTIKKRLRAGARRVALDLISAREQLARRRQEQALARPRVHLPYLHTVPPPEEDRFRAFVSELAADCTLVSYSEAVRLLRAGEVDRPYAAFSFDDGYASNVRTARILEDFGVSAMFFVPTGFLGTRTVDQARQFFGFDAYWHEPAMTWDDVEALMAAGHEIGNHTVNHRILSGLSGPQERHDEVGRAAEELRSRLGECRHFAWPYGRFTHFTDDAARAVFETGHETCASAERGAHVVPPVADPTALCLRRDHIMTEWPLRHSRHFIAASSAAAGAGSNDWPADWQVSD